MNEILLIVSTLFLFSSVLLFLRVFGKTGLYAWTALATLLANIEVILVVKAFGLEQTLGNILFASTFLCTDIASELYGKKEASRIVSLGILSSGIFLFISRSWLLYLPASQDQLSQSFFTVFSNTPRILLAGFIVYAISQKIDVWIYHFIWKHTGEERRGLWLRNNGSTLFSQAVNTILFTLGAFYGVFPTPVLLSIMLSTYLIYMILAVVDTVFVYFARRWFEQGKIPQ